MEADVSSVSPSSEPIEELWVVCGLYTEIWSYAIGCVAYISQSAASSFITEGSTESCQTLEQKFIFQIGTVNQRTLFFQIIYSVVFHVARHQPVTFQEYHKFSCNPLCPELILRLLLCAT